MNALDLLSSAAALELTGNNEDNEDNNPRVTGVKRKASSSNNDSSAVNVPASLASILSSSPQHSRPLPLLLASSSSSYVPPPPPTPLPEDSGIIRCFCGFDDDDGFTIQCERCFGWQHGLCVDISPESVPDVYICPLCSVTTTVTSRDIERAKRLQTLRKEAENGLRAATITQWSSNNNALPSSSPMMQQDQEYELLAKARGLAYQKSLDSIDPTGTLILPLPPSPSHHPTHSQYPHQQQQQLYSSTLLQSPNAVRQATPLLPLPPDAHTPIPYANPNRNQGIVNPFLPKSRQQSQQQQQRSPPNAHIQAQLQRNQAVTQQIPLGTSSVPASYSRRPQQQQQDSNTTLAPATSVRRVKSGSPVNPLTAAANAEGSTVYSSNAAAALQPPVDFDDNRISKSSDMPPPSSSTSIPPKQRRRGNQQHSISSLSQQKAGAADESAIFVASPGSGSRGLEQEGTPSLAGGFTAPAPPVPSRRRRSAGSALSQSFGSSTQTPGNIEDDKDLLKEKEREVLAAGLNTLQAGSLLGNGNNISTSTGTAANPTSISTNLNASRGASGSNASRPVRAARIQAAASISNTAATDNNNDSTSNNANAAGTPTNARDTFISEDEDEDEDGYEERYEPWMFEYTPIMRLRWGDAELERECKSLVDRYLEEEVENLVDGSLPTTTAEDQPNNSNSGNLKRPGPGLLLGTAISSFSNSTQQRLRTISPAPSSGSSTPGFSSTSASAVSSALSAPILPVIITTPLPSSLINNSNPDIFPSTSSSSNSSGGGNGKFTVKPLASTSFSLAPPACTPFSAPTCVTSLMNPYPRPTIHGCFSTSSTTAGSLISLMYGEVISGDEYRNNPFNQWNGLGVLKTHTRGIGMPWDLVLDQRRWSDESRFIRQGCHPNVFVRPIIVKKQELQDKSYGGSKRGKKRKLASSSTSIRGATTKEGEGGNGEYELAFGLYALYDISKREELVLPFDWADDHVIHSLHTLLFSPSLVFPTISTHTQHGQSGQDDHSSAEEDDDGIPSTSSFPSLTSSQKRQIARSTKHLYKLSRLANQTCTILLGTTICACEKRRDCSIGWLWKLGGFTESSSRNKGNLIKIKDFDLEGLRLACGTALGSDEKTGGNAGKGGKGKKMGKRRRADLGALVGLPRGWKRENGLDMAVLQGDKEEEMEPEEEEVVEQEPQIEVDITTNEPDEPHEIPKAQGEPQGMDLALEPLPPLSHGPVESQNIEEKALMEEKVRASPSIPAILQTLTPSTFISVTADSKSHPNQEVVQPLSSISTRTVVEPGANAEESDSDSDLTEPLPSAGEEETAIRPKPATATRSKPTTAEKVDASKPKSKGKTSAKKVAVEEDEDDNDDMDIEGDAEEEVVRPPKRNKSSTVTKSNKKSDASKNIKDTSTAGDKETKGVKEKFKAKTKDKSGKKEDKQGSEPKRTKSGSSLPAFRKKSTVMEEEKLQREKGPMAKPAVSPPLLSPAASSISTPTIPGVLRRLASNTIQPQSQQQQPSTPDAVKLDSLFDAPLPTSQLLPSPTVLEAAKKPTLEAAAAEASSDDDMQIDDDNTVPPSPEKLVPAPAEPPQIQQGRLQNSQPVIPAEIPQRVQPEPTPVPAPAPPRRVSFQAYKQRTSTLPKPVLTGETIAEETTDKASLVPSETGSGSVSPSKESDTTPLLSSGIVNTPMVEKSEIEAGLRSPSASKFPFPQQPSQPAASTSFDAPAPPKVEEQVFIPPTPPAPPRARLSFAAYRQRLSTTPLPSTTPSPVADKILPEPGKLVKSPPETPAIVPDLPVELVNSVKEEKEKEILVVPEVPTPIPAALGTQKEEVQVVRKWDEATKVGPASNAEESPNTPNVTAAPAPAADAMQMTTPEVTSHIVNESPAAQAEEALTESGQPKSENQPAKKDVEEEEEQEEGEVWVDPNLEPGELTPEVDEMAVEQRAAEERRRVEEPSRGRALAPPILHTPANDRSLTPPPRRRSLTPPIQRRRSLTPPPRRSDVTDSARGRTPPRIETSYNRPSWREAAHPSSAHSRAATPPPREIERIPAREQGPPLSDTPIMPASPPRPTSIQRAPHPLSPPAASASLASRGPPTGPRGTSTGPPSGYWPASGGRGSVSRGSSNFTSGPAYAGRGRGGTPSTSRDNRDTGGFGTSGGGGSSYRPEGAGQGPPPSAPRADREPPSGPRALQGRGDGPPSYRGRGGYNAPPPSGPSSMLPRDKGWGNRGRGHSRGRGRGGYSRD